MLFFLCLTGENYFLPTMLGRIESCGCLGELIHFSAKGLFIQILVLCIISFATFCLVIKGKQPLRIKKKTPKCEVGKE